MVIKKKNKTENFVESKALANSRKSLSESLKKRAETEERKKEEENERQRNKFLAKKVEIIENNVQKKEQKWKTVITTRLNRLRLEKEAKERKEEQIEQLKLAAESMRKSAEEHLKMSQQKALEEKAEKAEKLRKEKARFKIQSKILESKRKEETNSWIYTIHLAKNLAKISKMEDEMKREQAREEAEAERLRLHYELQAKRESQKIQDKVWMQRVSINAIKLTEKLRRKRKEREPDAKIFMSRFRRLQIELRKRKEKERMRKLREEEKRLKAKRKRHEKELIRRTEATARLEKLQHMQKLKDSKRTAEMDKIQQQYEAEQTVFEAQKKLISGITDQLRTHAKKIKKQKERNAKSKIKVQMQMKEEKELQRRSAVSHALTKYRNHARNLAERRARKLAEEEVAWHIRRQQADAHNRWVRSQYAARVKNVSLLEKKKKIAQQKKELQAQEDKKQAELQRRNDVLRRIDHAKGHQALVDKHGDIQDEPRPEVRREFLQIQQNEHTRKISDATREKWKEAEDLRKLAESLHKIYIKDREIELHTFKNKKQAVLKKATKKVWR